jgi:hypothetical protein
MKQQLQAEQGHADRHEHVGNPQRRPEGRIRPVAIDPGFAQHRPGFPAEEGAEQKADGIRERQAHAVDPRREQGRQHLDGDMPASRLYERSRQEGRAHQQEHRGLVLPVGRDLEEVASDRAIGQDRRRHDQRRHAGDRDDPVTGLHPPFEPRDDRGDPVASRGRDLAGREERNRHLT